VQHTDFNGWVENTYRAYVQYSSPVVISNWYFPMSSYTLEYWYYYSGSTNGSFGFTVFAYANNDNMNYRLIIGEDSNNLNFDYLTIIHGYGFGLGSSVPKAVGWYHHAVVVNYGQNFKQYINGVLMSTDTIDWWDMYATQYQPGNFQVFGVPGGYKYLKMYNRALTGSQIAAIYNAGV